MADSNVKQGVYSGEPRDIGHPSIEAIGSNKKHPDVSNVTATGPFTFGKVPTKSQN
jgi:hypothetical protein